MLRLVSSRSPAALTLVRAIHGPTHDCLTRSLEPAPIDQVGKSLKARLKAARTASASSAREDEALAAEADQKRQRAHEGAEGLVLVTADARRLPRMI